MGIARAWRIGAAVIVAAVLALGGFAVYRAQSQQASVVTVNGQDIPPALYEQAQTQTAILQQDYPGYYKTFGNINRLIEDMLITQEATRRGLACNDAQGAAYAATEVAVATYAVGGSGSVLDDANAFGIVLPPGYLQTPEPARTPSTQDAIATWEANPDIIKGYADLCTRGNLFSAVITPGATLEQQAAAHNGLLAQLRAAAHITGSTVPVDSPTPSALTTDTPVPPAATATP